MSIDRKQIEDVLIEPTLREMDRHLPGVYSKSAINMLLGILAQESAFGTYLVQKGANSDIGAKGIYQIEAKTHQDVLDNFLKYNEYLGEWVMSQIPDNTLAIEDITLNLKYSTIIARLILWRDSKPLPDHNDIEAMAKYYKRVYNTPLGKATEEEFVNNYKRYVLGE